MSPTFRAPSNVSLLASVRTLTTCHASLCSIENRLDCAPWSNGKCIKIYSKKIGHTFTRYIHAYIHTHRHTYTHAFTCMTCMHTCMHTYVRAVLTNSAQTRKHTHIHCVHYAMLADTRAYTHTHTHIHAHTHTHTCMHIRTYAIAFLRHIG